MPDFTTMLAHAGHVPWLQALAIVIGTFILEDAATVLTGMAVQAGSVALATALPALYAGIILGDIGLYGLGAAAARWPAARRWARAPVNDARAEWLRAHVLRTVFVCRFIPGARLPIYTACGFFHAGLVRFTVATAAATLLWTSALFGVSVRIGQVLMTYLGVWRWVGAAGFVITIVVVGRIAAHLQKETP